MFDQYLADERRARRGWSFAGSLGLQVVGVAGLAVLPLIHTYEIDLGAWAGIRIRLAVPPPPAPPPPRAAPAPTPAPRRYEAQFQAPSAIPDRIALLQDVGAPASPLASQPAPRGLEGGLGRPGVPGVLGVIPGMSGALPLPPPVRIGGNVQNARILSRVMPVYPMEAVEAFVSGTVKLEAIIGVDGRVRDLKLVEGHPMLATAAVEAVSQWRYRPTRLNGREVEVVTLVDVHFNLTLPEEEGDGKRKERPARRG